MNVMRTTERAILPTRKHKEDAGLDFYSPHPDFIIPPFSFAIVDTEVKINLPPETVGLLFPKGKNDHLVGAGVVDCNYQGTIRIKLVNYSDSGMLIKMGDGVAQMVIVPILLPAVIETKTEEETFPVASDRGETGGIVTQATKMYVGTDLIQGTLEFVEDD